MKTLILVFCMFLLSACSDNKTTGVDYLEDVNYLETIIPKLEKHNIEGYRYQDWCKILRYKGVEYIDSKSNNCTVLTIRHFTKPTQEFSPEAKKMLNYIHDKLNRRGSPNIIIIDSISYKGSKIEKAEFHLDTSFTRESLIYEPNYNKLPKNISGKIMFKPISKNWFYKVEDWN